jgi:capsid protein
MRVAKAQDGEAFAVMFTNSTLGDDSVYLDLKLIEADQVATPGFIQSSDMAVDGIKLDKFGNPESYDVLKHHPGGLGGFAADDSDSVAASDVCHWFREDRPGQYRGLPEIMPALPLCAQMRRYTLAVIAAAESAAEMAVIMKTTLPENQTASAVDPMMTMDWETRQAVFSPEGWEPYQIKAEQPSTTYEMFKREIINEMARCLNMPYNIAACNSASYNYASGRLDHQTYFKSIEVERSDCEIEILDRILSAWLPEADRVYGIGDVDIDGHTWVWGGREHVDPQKEAQAQATKLANYSTTLALEYAKQGLDWEPQVEQRFAELDLIAKRSPKLPAQLAPPDQPQDSESDDEQDAEDETEDSEEMSDATA